MNSRPTQGRRERSRRRGRIRLAMRTLAVALVFLVGCGSSGIPRPEVDARLELKLSLDSQAASVGDTITITHTLINIGNGSVTLCRTANYSLEVGPLRQRSVTVHGGCISATRATLKPGESVAWTRPISLGSCDEENSFLRKYLVCPGTHPMSAEQEVLLGEECVAKNPCSRMTVTSSPTVLLVE